MLPAILVFSKLLGLVTCEESGLSLSATQMWPLFSAGFVLAERWMWEM